MKKNLYNLIPFIPIFGIPLYYGYRDLIDIEWSCGDIFNSPTSAAVIVVLWQLIILIGSIVLIFVK